MKGLVLSTLIGAALLSLVGNAEAGSGHHSHKHGHRHDHHHHGAVGGFRYYSPAPVYASPVVPIYRPPVYHDNTHLDYHPPTVYQHGWHTHMVPGHYDVHRSGHWHY